MEKFSYIKIPVSMIPLLYDGRQGLIDVLLYGIYNTAKFDCDDYNIARQLLYSYMCQDPKKRRVSIPERLYTYLDGMDWESDMGLSDNDYRGFTKDGSEFDPETILLGNVIPLLAEELNEQPELHDLAREFYCIRQCAEMLGIGIPDTDLVIQKHELYKDHDECRVFAYAKLDNIMKLISKGDKITSEDIELFAGYLAFKSILGRNKIGRAEKSLVVARMMGCVSSNDIEDDGSNIISETSLRIFKKYSDKENFRRLTGRLRDGYVKYIQTVPGKNRLGMFFSFSRDLSVKDFNSAIEEMVIADRKKAQRDKKRIQRKRKKKGCRKAVEDVTVTTKTKQPLSMPFSMVQKPVKQAQPYQPQFTVLEKMPFPPELTHRH